ncbi:unnamed protein product, partial [Prunus brigantina]
MYPSTPNWTPKLILTDSILSPLHLPEPLSFSSSFISTLAATPSHHHSPSLCSALLIISLFLLQGFLWIIV